MTLGGKHRQRGLPSGGACRGRAASPTVEQAGARPPRRRSVPGVRGFPGGGLGRGRGLPAAKGGPGHPAAEHAGARPPDGGVGRGRGRVRGGAVRMNSCSS
ncbi:hypothetical protein PVAP13_8NG138901 [Panicum virgatum]|uniref:Uncharacterized protein n=1 Tax=Panicum virgatum TaxID=38727 RepID=A0A8T0PBX5_PANVG|nr:hypothetical protein PVAP13_8NG138901 [Panicum virgatum]